MKWRNSKERELLANGGSRDQTLPNKNNPNPDLSDARNERPVSLSPPSSPSQLDSPSRGNGNTNNSSVTSQPPNSPPDVKFPTNTFQVLKQKFDISNPTEMKYELDDTGRQMGKFFPDRDLSTGIYHNTSSTGSSDYKGTNMCDEYDSPSDSDEEINVT